MTSFTRSRLIEIHYNKIEHISLHLLQTLVSIEIFIKFLIQEVIRHKQSVPNNVVLFEI